MKTAVRIPNARYVKDEIFKEHIEYIKSFSDVVDEVAIFTEYSHHGYWTLDYIKNLAEILKKRIPEYRKAGVKNVGLNVLITLGHLDEAWDVLAKPPMQTMVSIDGYVTTSNLCPNTDEFREYIAEKYRIFAGVNPDFIWIDDDFRINNHGEAGPCFCDNCIAKFNKKYGLNESFESLTSKVKENSDIEFLQKWERFCIDSLTEVAEIIEKAIHSVNPDIEIGKMGCMEDTYNEWLDAFKVTKYRPGGGFYCDNEPEWVEIKFLICENQNSFCPDEIKDRQYEFENFPDQGLGKSQRLTRLESLYALMNGCNGIAYNILGYVDDPKTLSTVRDNKPLFDEISKIAPDMQNNGIYCIDVFKTTFDFMKIGLPMTADKRNASAYILLGDDVNLYTDEEIMKILSGAVFLDNNALDILVKKGYGEYIGVKSSEYYDNGIMEIFTDSEINGKYKGYTRSGWVSFNRQRIPMATLEITGENVEVISDLYTVSEDRLGPCMTLYKNKLGGSVAVSTYMCTNYIQYVEKREQLLNLFDKMIPGGLPVRVNAEHKVVPILKNDKDGYILMLSNMSHDEISEFTVDIKGGKGSIINADGKLLPVKAEEINGKTRFYIEGITPFDAVFITNK